MKGPIKVGIIGTGYWGPNLIKSFASAGAEISWICDLNSENLNHFSKLYPHAKFTQNYEEVLNDVDVDAVAISTPTSTHYEISRKSLIAKKHVFVEKPLTDNLDQALELEIISKQSGLVLLVGHVFQYNNTIRYLKELIKSNELGRIHYLNFVRTNLGPIRTDVNSLWDLATHDISIMYFIFEKFPKSVSAFGKSYLNQNIEDVVFINFEYEDNLMVQIHVSWLNPKKIRQITAVGDKKMAEVDDLDLKQPIKIYNKKVKFMTSKDNDGSFLAFKTSIFDGGVSSPNILLNMPLEDECRDFILSVENKRSPNSDINMGIQIVRLCSVANESLKNNGKRLII